MLDRTDKTWTLSRVRPDDVLLVWPQLQPEIVRCLTKGQGDTLTERGLFEGVMSGSIELWVAHDGLDVKLGMFLKIVQRDRGKALVVLAGVAGSGHGFMDYTKNILPVLRDYGRMIGAYTVEACARPGVAHMLKRLGCKPKAIVMEMYDER